jgi:hypothetical protein
MPDGRKVDRASSLRELEKIGDRSENLVSRRAQPFLTMADGDQLPSHPFREVDASDFSNHEKQRVSRL